MTESFTANRFDHGFQSNRPRKVIWTLEAIGCRVGASADFVRDTMSKLPGTPVRKMGSRWYALEDELDKFLENGAAHPDETA